MGKIETFRNIIWTLLEIVIAYGLFAVFIPRELLSLNLQLFPMDIGPVRYGGLICMIIGTAINLKCYWDLIFSGKGTLGALIPTVQLVSRGLYQFMRNPVYVGFFLILFGEAVLFMSAVLLVYSLLWLLVLNLIVVFIEEPSLRRRFGDSYDDYVESVPRWIPRFKTYREDN
ncbi:MAG: isoprenylcysteine carboxylmethyltransferase family protein [Proteobacteria bacterium]|nr:isoprenylcysteine carboxylmethyltransferase family protein [Pseudomonadota bacterium]MBU1696560.1 isoprenylcysteine carboxylmethyltransferase family protein [Pseudomonadota bacterium]